MLAEGPEAAAELIAPIAYPAREVKPRSDPSEAVIASIYRRDHFHCRYCGCRVIPTQIMRLVSEVFPEEFPYHPNWKAGQTHPAIASRSATLDHVEPWSTGGANAPGNFACACWVCNRVKGDLTLKQLGWELLPIADRGDWDGVTRYYPALWELAGRPRSADHVLWLRLFDPSGEADGEASSIGDASRILSVEAFQDAIQSDSGLVVTDAATRTTFHASPRGCPHVRQESFEEKVIENGERNGNYFVASSFAEAKERWPEARRCVSSACTSLV